MNRYASNFGQNSRRACGDPHRRSLARAAAAALLALPCACFSPAPYTEHLCRECTSECPAGLVCHEQRCVRVCDSSCVGDYQCVGEVCLPSSGADQCPTRSVPFALCVGLPVDEAMAAPASSSSDEPWVVIDSRLPDGVDFDPDTGKLVGTPTRAEPGSITVRQGEPGSEEVSLDLLATESCASIETTAFAWCSGQSHSERLVASPAGDDEWHLSSPVPGLSQRGSELAGRIDEPGTYPIGVELWRAGRIVDTATIEIRVDDCGDPAREPAPPGLLPLQISAPALPDGCAGSAYRAVFEAAGGEPAYRWSLAAPPPGLALGETSGELSGTPLESGDFELAVRVDDAAGRHDDLVAALRIASPSEGCSDPDPDTTSGETPECGVGGAEPCARPPLEIVTTELPVACAGADYSARLEASGGGGDYRWRLPSPEYPAPSGLVLESTGELHGVPALDAAGEHTLSVYVMSTLTDTPSYASVTLRVEVCDGLVFISDEPGSDRLYRVSAGAGASSELSQGTLGAGENVRSFAFAPGGAELAFDVRSDGGASRLYRLDLAAPEPREPAFAGPLPDGAALIDYRWSLDGRQLAASFRAGNRVFLGVAPAGGGAGSSIEISGRYVSSLFWAADRICYVAPGLEAPFLGVLCHAITTQGVQDQAPLSGIFTPIDFRQDLILSGDEGYLSIFANAIHAEYLLPSERATSVRHANRVFSPGLHRAAGLSTTEPSVGEVVTSRGMPSAPASLARLEPCDRIDAWSLDERWLACSSGDALSIHQLGPAGALARSAGVDDSDGYAGEERRRLWAPEGQWYAYVAGGELRVVPTGSASPVARRVATGGATSSYAGLGTDADGARIFYHHGSELEVIDTRADYRRRNVSGSVLLSDPPPCLEEYLEEGPRLWCGSASTPAFFFPAHGAPLVAFVDRQNRLYVADVSDGATTSSPRLLHGSSVKCTMDSGQTECDSFVQWVPRPSK